MQLHTQKESLLTALFPFRNNKTVGFVPTMGALHEGHLSLVSKSLQENDCTVVSIFVNPTQFNNARDLDKYPRTLEADITLLNTLKGEIIVFSPEAKELYQENIQAKNYNFEGLEKEMEGKFRNGHFDGVGTVLNLLFRIIEPQKTYFGEKDFQQLQVVKKMVAIEELPVTIVGCPILREENGLAMSSRNKRLSEKQKEEASLISEVLFSVQNDFKTKSISEINEDVVATFKKTDGLTLEYFEIASAKTLKPTTKKSKNIEYRAFIAAFAGEVRLIDNVALSL